MAVVFKNSISSNDKEYNSFIDCLVTGTQKQVQINDSIDDINTFFDALETLDTHGRITSPVFYKRESALDMDYLYINFNSCYMEYSKYLRETGTKQIISKEELKQKLEFNISKEYYFENKKENYFTSKFGTNAARCFVFSVEKNGFAIKK
jgi:hypothetical protein